MADPEPSSFADFQYELDTIKQHVNFEQPPPTPGQEWRSLPELPSSQDLNPNLDDPEEMKNLPPLLPNTWQEPWSDKNKYLETHYRLQRESAITMLRYSIRKIKMEPFMMDDDETCIYSKVFVKGYLMSRLGPMCRIQFSTERSGKKIRWAQTRRLATGSLVALSTAKDCFKTICLPAIIADHQIRDGLEKNPPTIHIQWASQDDAVMDPSTELIMVEARTSYFEAMRHTMVGLQHVAMSNTPIDKYLVQADKSDRPAKYVQENANMNISSLIHHVPKSDSMPKDEAQELLTETRKSFESYPIVNGIDDKISTFTNLDNSQLSAVHRILTKELAIVQGPPGTGKTFTSVQAVRILLESQERGSNVIIVAAQTNHAVDQLLIQLIKLGFNAVRLGGRSQNENIKRFSMYNLRRSAMPSSAHRADRDYRTFEAARKRNISVLENVVEDVFPRELIDPDVLHRAGIISETQLQSLKPDVSWTGASSSAGQPPTPMAEWLRNQVVKVIPQVNKDPVFEAEEDDDGIDLEDEDYGLDLDDTIADDDDKLGRLDGKFVPIEHRWTAANPLNYTENDLPIHRDLKKQNLWDIDIKHRGAVYQYWQRELLRLREGDFRSCLGDNVRITKNLKVNRWYKDTQCIKSSSVEIIGCTTTGLCKYRGLLAALRPRTMLIEEAAETREANILSALYESLQQLILVGDHQQLAPHCDVELLGIEPYNLRVSMFERLVKLEMPFTMLNMQRRMAPGLRKILNPFYPDLEDHPVVTNPKARPPVPGMGNVQSYFFHHTWPEGVDENRSKFNDMEADMIVRFIEYLLMNGADASQITVLTFYRGQRKKIMLGCKKKLTHRAPFTNVHTVDSYQGEENDIVILSLVRSRGRNGPHAAGFLEDENRAVVSISRARRGFFIFGNMINLQNASDQSFNVWGKVKNVFQREGHFGGDSYLPVTCQKHKKTLLMSHPEDWLMYHGGCELPCPELLDCGHPCGRRCHWVPHDKLICQKPCERVLRCGHRCQEVCGERCVCDCSDFTGAYPDDEGWEDETTVEVDGITVNYNFDNVPPFAYKHHTRPGGRGKSYRGRGDRYGSRGRRGGVGFTGGNHAIRSSEDVNHGNFVHQGDGHNYTWGNFNAKLDDAQRLEESRRQAAEQQVMLIDHPSQASSASQSPDKHLSHIKDIAIRETFRPVTLNNLGKRNVGEGIISDNSATPSPEKNGVNDDLLNFDDDNTDTKALSLPSQSNQESAGISVGARARVSTPQIIDPTHGTGEEVAASTPTRRGRDDQLNREIYGLQETQVDGGTRATPAPIPMRAGMGRRSGKHQQPPPRTKVASRSARERKFTPPTPPDHSVDSPIYVADPRVPDVRRAYDKRERVRRVRPNVAGVARVIRHVTAVPTRRAAQQIDQREWEVASSIADDGATEVGDGDRSDAEVGGSGGDYEDVRNGEEDLINF
ncbi:P-loop containing nucleoside triphosphate hydrolase protein [Whalleya microplaca]|nr:P-loop containing nucleoside triphosphate hydrolase protein [Whalleya microplaca]